MFNVLAFIGGAIVAIIVAPYVGFVLKIIGMVITFIGEMLNHFPMIHSL